VVKTLSIEPESPWENGYTDHFTNELRDELLNVELLDTLPGARVLVRRQRRHHNTVRPHG
jgi:putative transposase